MRGTPVRGPAGKALRTMAIALIALAAGLLGLAGALLLASPGKVLPYVGEDGRPLAGSVSEKLRVPINGLGQGMFLKGRDARNPVLLFLHGGPGMPEYFLDRSRPTGLDSLFTVCWWDQRGAGLSFDPGTTREELTVERSMEDAIAVAEYLRARFGQDRIYLMGHSNGSFLGLRLAARRPDLFHAYVGIAQVAYQLRSENLAYAYLLARYRELGDRAMVRQLEAAPVAMTYPLPDAYRRLRDPAMHGIGVGTTRDMRSVVTGIFLPSLLHPEYTLGEKIGLWRGKILSGGSPLWDEMQTTDLAGLVEELGIPAYFLHGLHDYTVTYAETRSFAAGLRAPVKGFYTFPDSAHGPLFEEPERMRRILAEDVLRGRSDLAD